MVFDSTGIVSPELLHQLHDQNSSIADRSPSQPSKIPLTTDNVASNEKIKTAKLESSSSLSKWKSQWITNWWGLELICWVIAAISLAAIVITLEIYKNKPVPRWFFGINLNTCKHEFRTSWTINTDPFFVPIKFLGSLGESLLF